MKKNSNIEIALEIVDNLTGKQVFKDEESENAATEIVLRVLQGYDEINPKQKTKRKLKDRTIDFVDKMQYLSNQMFDNIKESLNKKDEDEN